VIGEKTLADAARDRLIHNAFQPEMVRESLRKRQTILN